MRTTRVIVLAAIVTIAAACGSDDPSAPPLDLSGTWQLVSGSHDGEQLDPIPDHPVTIEFETERIAGTAACNGYGGTFVTSGQSTTFSDLNITEMACVPSETMDLEGKFMESLTEIVQYELDRAHLVLTGPDTILEFEQTTAS